MLTIAVVQFRIRNHNPKKNLQRAEAFLRQAKDKAQMIVFPEDFITGPMGDNETLVDKNKTYCNHFQKLARKYNLDIVCGSWIEGEKHDWYNTTYYIDSSGKIRGKYRKINLWHPERRYLTSGNEISIFNTKYGKVGLIIC